MPSIATASISSQPPTIIPHRSERSFQLLLRPVEDASIHMELKIVSSRMSYSELLMFVQDLYQQCGLLAEIAGGD